MPRPSPQKLVEYVAKQPHVTMATGVFSVQVEGVTLGGAGIDYPEFDKMSGGFNFLSGGPFQQPDDVIIDDYYADQTKARVGRHHHPLEFEMARLRHHGERQALAHRVAHRHPAASATTTPANVNQIYVKLDDPANTAGRHRLPARSQSRTPGGLSHLSPMKEFTSLLNVNNIPALAGFIAVVMGIGVVIGFAVVCLSMYMAVLQRTREIGILKILGASKGFILRHHPERSPIPGIGRHDVWESS